MSVVKIFAFLGLEQNWAFFKGLILCLLLKRSKMMKEMYFFSACFMRNPELFCED